MIFCVSLLVPLPAECHISVFYLFEEIGDQSAAGNCIPSGGYQVQVAGHFVLPITRQYVCVDVTTLGNMESDLSAQFSSYKKSIVIACRVMLNADSGCLWGCKLVIIVVTQRWDDKQRATNCYMLAVPLGRRSLCLCCLHLSCLGANDTTQSLWETLPCGCVGCAAAQQGSS